MGHVQKVLGEFFTRPASSFTSISWIVTYPESPMCKRPRTEMMHEAISGTRQRESRLPRLAAQVVRIEQTQIRPRLQFNADLG